MLNFLNEKLTAVALILNFSTQVLSIDCQTQHTVVMPPQVTPHTTYCDNSIISLFFMA